MNLLCRDKGIVKVKKTSFVKKLLCKHTFHIEGISCSDSGLVRISGEDRYRVCENCGKILQESHTQY